MPTDIEESVTPSESTEPTEITIGEVTSNEPVSGDSILNTIKKLLGIDASYHPFDTDIIIHINTYLGVLNDLGVGVLGFTITGPNETWSEFLSGSAAPVNEARTYVYLRVRMAFDPPTSGIVTNAIEKQIEELGWRLRIKVECSV